MKKLTRIGNLLFSLFLMVFLWSCAEADMSDEQPAPPKSTYLTFSVTTVPMTTRGAQGPYDDVSGPKFDSIRSIMVVAADKQMNIIDHAMLQPASGSQYQCKVKVMPTDSTYLYFIANSKNAENLMGGSNPPITIDELSQSDVFEASTSESGVGGSIVMWQKHGIASGETTITKPITLLRSVARIKLKYRNLYQEVDSIKISGTAEKGLLWGKKSSSDGFTITDKKTGIGGSQTTDSLYYYYVYPTSEPIKATLYIGSEERALSLGNAVEPNQSYSIDILYDGPVVSHGATDNSTEYIPNKKEFSVKAPGDDLSFVVVDGSTIDTDNPSWIIVPTESAAQVATNNDIKISLKPNYSGAKRLGTVTIKKGIRQTTFTISQESYDVRNDGDSRLVLGPETGKAFNIVVLGDGFTREDNIVAGEFDAQVQKIIDFMFLIEPLKSHKEYFRIYQVYAESQERGAANTPSQNVNTVFNATYNVSGIGRLLAIRNTQNAVKYAAMAIPTADINMYLVLVNDTRYGGSGGKFITTSVNGSSPEIALHEMGHGFGLTDEYADPAYVAAAGLTRAGAKKWPNASDTSDPATVKWSHFIGRPGYEAEGVYEGGFYFATGVWRPSRLSIMNGLYSRYFNAISRETIVRKVLGIIGKPFDIEDFYLRDVPPVMRTFMGVEVQNEMPVPTELYFDSTTGKYKWE